MPEPRAEEERLDRLAEEAVARPELSKEAREVLRSAPRWRAAFHLYMNDSNVYLKGLDR